MILLVEDEEWRRKWFREHSNGDLDMTANPDEAIQWLAERPYDILWLDHDLGCEPKAGRDVAKWLIAHPDRLPHLCIYVHSVNAVSGPKIERELREVGRPAHWIPFTQLVGAAPLHG